MNAVAKALEHAATAVAQRATWPSLHWKMRPHLHPEAALALAEAAIRAYLASTAEAAYRASSSDESNATDTDRETSR